MGSLTHHFNTHKVFLIEQDSRDGTHNYIFLCAIFS